MARPTESADTGDEAIRVRGLRKSYGDVQAVAGIDFAVAPGEVFALLGPNGAGKTTTVEILEGYRHRDGGEVAVLGLDPGRERTALKPRIGIVLQSSGVDRYLTVAETIAMYSMSFPHPRPVDEVIELVGLGGKRDSRVVKLSGGQQRRLDVAIALAGDPELLFLDEPTTGFDPSARREAWHVIKSLTQLGKTVLLTTHYMDEAQNLANRVAVVAGGRIVAEGTPETLGGRDTARVTIRYRLPAGVAPPADLGLSAVARRVRGVRAGRSGSRAAPAQRLGDREPALARRPADPAAVTRGRVPGTDPRRGGRAERQRGGIAMSAVVLTATQIRYVNKAFWRNPAAAFFTFAFPLMFLVIFTALLGQGHVQIGGREVHQSTYYVAAMAAFSVITACYNNIAVSIAVQRDAGILKRTNGTPLPAVVVPGRPDPARDVRRRAAGGDHRRVRQGVLPRGGPLGRFARAVPGDARGRRRLLLRARLRDHTADSERGRRRADRERNDPAAAVPVRDLHPAR